MNDATMVCSVSEPCCVWALHIIRLDLALWVSTNGTSCSSRANPGWHPEALS